MLTRDYLTEQILSHFYQPKNQRRKPLLRYVNQRVVSLRGMFALLLVLLVLLRYYIYYDRHS